MADGIIESGEFDPDVPQYEPLTPEQVDELAKKIYRNEVFTSWMVSKDDAHLLTSIFMPLMFLDDISRKSMARDKIAHLYADMREAGPRSINGYPIFLSMGVLTAGDAKRVADRVSEICKILGDI